MRAFSAAAVLFLLSGCATVGPSIEPTSVDHGLLIARARVAGALVWFTADYPDRATVELLDANGEPVPGKVAVSGFSGDGGIYFLDLPPGRYALTSLSFPARGARYEVVLSSAAMRRETVELRPGKAAFLGSLSLEGVFPDVDVAFERALDVVGRWITPFLRHAPIPRDAELRGVARDAETEASVLREARKDLADTQWRGAVDDRLKELSVPAPAATAGWRGREVPLNSETFFSWRDTLKWGKPVRTEEGAAWRRPKGQARVAVFFTSATAPGFAGYEEAVRQLRTAAGALEDPAALYEVRVGTYTGRAARVTTHHYPESSLVGSEVTVLVTETILVSSPAGMYTARLRAPRDEFEKVLPAFREFLLQLTLGPPAKAETKQEPVLPL